MFDENQKTILLSFSLKTQRDVICKKEKEKEKQFGFPRNRVKMHSYQHQILPNTSTVPANFWLGWVTDQ